MLFHIRLTFWVTLFMALSTLATRAEVFDCKVKNHGPYLMIADRIVFDVDTRTRNVLVADGLLAHFHQLPAAGTLKRYNEKQVIVAWKMHASAGNGSHDGVAEDVFYRAMVNRKTKAVTVTSYFDPVYQVKATGKCAMSKSEIEQAQDRPSVVEDERQGDNCEDGKPSGGPNRWNC